MSAGTLLTRGRQYRLSSPTWQDRDSEAIALWRPP